MNLIGGSTRIVSVPTTSAVERGEPPVVGGATPTHCAHCRCAQRLVVE